MISDRRVKTVLVLKYIVPEHTFPTLWFGVANVIANALIMIRYGWHNSKAQAEANNTYSSAVLWVSQNMEDEYSYNLAL